MTITLRQRSRPTSMPGCQFPAAQHADRVGLRPAHDRPDLAGGAARQRANVLGRGRKREQPFFPQYRKLLAELLDAAVAINPAGYSATSVALGPTRSHVVSRLVVLKSGCRFDRGQIVLC
jgi:hypothetical protein